MPNSRLPLSRHIALSSLMRRHVSVRLCQRVAGPLWQFVDGCVVLKLPSVPNFATTGALQKIVPARGQLIVCSRQPLPSVPKQTRPILLVQSSSREASPTLPRTAGASLPRCQQPCSTLRSLLAKRSAGSAGEGGAESTTHCSIFRLKSSVTAAC